MASSKKDVQLDENDAMITSEEVTADATEETVADLGALLDDIAQSQLSEAGADETAVQDEWASEQTADPDAVPATAADVADQNETAEDSVTEPAPATKKKPAAKKKASSKGKPAKAADEPDEVASGEDGVQQELDDLPQILAETVFAELAQSDDADMDNPPDNAAGGDEMWALEAAEHLSAEAYDANVAQPDAVVDDTPADTGMRISTRKNAFPSDEPPAPARRRPARIRAREVLTIQNGRDVVLPSSEEDEVWHEIKNSQLTRRILTGKLDGVERLENRGVIALATYKDLRIVIPASAMNLQLRESQTRSGLDVLNDAYKRINSMMECEIDFIIKGFDQKKKAILASRVDAMNRKRRTFYMRQDDNGEYMVKEGGVVEARVLAVAEKIIRVEAFGVETVIPNSQLAWEWIGDARDRYEVGDQILIRVNKIDRSPETFAIEADVRSLTPNTVAENLKKIKVQGKYAGVVTDIYKGIVYVRLNIGVNAIAHSCQDRRKPGKRDTVSMAITHIDNDRNVALGMITRIIKQNI